ncbi:LysE family translocator [Labrenzia sp. PHM005]|uniref:LysE family translocator n=1 Tax=Labrenzia sp. PHM005 TaxID=2590016 RepID=UPI0011405B1E|nr:LysE family translocator [Labrenzia sp. PHM005]QDG75118.1 LysE family translocator [Labrenzia sp. PHM005]
MPDLSTLIVFTTACLVLTATPGPDMLLIASRSVTQGRSSGFLTYAGIAAGSYCHALAAGLGLSQLFLAVPVAYEVVRWAGAGYLLVLAWKAFRSPAASFTIDKSISKTAHRRIFIEGLLTNILNPKMALFMLALFPQFLHMEAGPVLLQVLILATVLNVTGLIVNGTVVLFSHGLRQHFGRQTRFKKLGQYLLASVFAGLAIRVALSERN